MLVPKSLFLKIALQLVKNLKFPQEKKTKFTLAIGNRQRNRKYWHFLPLFSQFTELIPNDDLIKPHQTEIVFSAEEFEQLLNIQQDLLEDIIVEDQSNGEIKNLTSKALARNEQFFVASPFTLVMPFSRKMAIALRFVYVLVNWI